MTTIADRECSDCDGLGAILYSLIAGRPPFEADNSLTMLRRVERDAPIAPRTLNPAISADLNTICLKCLEKEPRLRYDSAASLADDLDRLVRGEPVRARPIPSWERAWRWGRRNPVTAALILATTCLVVVLAVGGPWLATRAIQARSVAEKSRDEAVRAQQEVESRMADVYTNNGQIVRMRWEWGEARLWYALAASLSADPAKQTANLIRAEYLRQIVPQPVRAMMFSGKSIRTLEFHPSGQSLLCGDREGAFVVWNLAKNQDPQPIGNLTGITCAAWSRDGTRLAAGTKDGSLAVFSTAEMKAIWNERMAGRIRSLAIDAERNRLAASSEQTAGIWLMPDGDSRMAGFSDLNLDDVHHLEFNRRGDRLLVHRAAEVSILNVANPGAPIAAPLFHPVPQQAAIEFAYSLRPRFVDDESFMAVDGASARVYDATTGKERYILNTGTGRSTCSVSVNGPGSSILVAGNTTARLWRQHGELTAFHGRHREPVVATAFHPDGHAVATGSLDGEVRLWTPPNTKPRANISHPSGVTAICFSPDGQLLATAQTDGLVRIWRVDPEAFAIRYRAGEVAMGRAAPTISLTPDGKHWFISACQPDPVVGRQFQVFSMTGQPEPSPLELNGLLCNAAMSADGKLVAIVSRVSSDEPSTTNRLQLWLWPTRQALGDPIELPVASTAIHFRPDGHQLAVLTEDGKVRCLDPKPRERRLDVAFSVANDRSGESTADAQGAGLLYTRDGRYLIAWNCGNYVYIWSTESGQLRCNPIELTGASTSVALSDDERWLATATDAGDVQVWDFASGTPAFSLRTHAGRVNSIRFSPDGKRVLTACEDDYVRTIRWRRDVMDDHSFNTRTDAFDAVYAPNGKWFVTASDTNPCTIHAAADGQLMAYLEPPEALNGTISRTRQTQLTFTPDGRYLIAAGGRQSVRIFDVAWISNVDAIDRQRLQWEAELSSGRRVIDGTTTPISSAEWLASWLEYKVRFPAELTTRTDKPQRN